MMPLASLVLLSACANQPVATVDREQLCKSWRHQTIGKDDVLTDKTASGIEGSNAARTAWGCAWGKRTVKS